MPPTAHKIMWGVDVAPAMPASKFGECNFLIWQVKVPNSGELRRNLPKLKEVYVIRNPERILVVVR